MTKLGAIFEDLKLSLPSRSLENWKYTPVRKLLETEFLDHNITSSNTPCNNDNAHPFVNLCLASAEKIDHIEINAPTLEPLRIIIDHHQNALKIIHRKIHVAANVAAEIIIDYVSSDDSVCFSAILTEITLEKNAELSVYKNQALNHESSCCDFFLVNQKAQSSFFGFTLDKGASLSRTDFVVHLNEPQAEASVHGIYFTKGEQVADHHSVIHHHVPHCQSSEHYHGILNDKSKAIFNGKVVIDKDAQQSSAKQLNKNILLSSQAEVDTKPELEIYANDVKASHGATVGQLDEQALFYLLTRGIERQAAISLLMTGFVKEVLLTIPNEKIRHSFVELVEQLK